MKTIFLIQVLLLVSNTCFSYQWFSPLTKDEEKWQIAYILVTCLDWAQTKEFRSQNVPESNSYLDKEPDQERIDILIISGIIGHTLMTWIIQHEFRKVWTISFLAIETQSVLHNYYLGYGPELTINF